MAERARRTHLAAVPLDDPPHRREPDPGAGELALAVQALERREELGGRARVEARSVVDLSLVRMCTERATPELQEVFAEAQKRFLSQNPKFALSALSRYTPQDFIALVKRYGIAFHEKVGFRTVAVIPEAGRKFGRWLDLVLMMKFL